MPGRQPPTRHPRRGGVGTVSVGERLTAHFTGVDPAGAAIARLGAVTLRVPFGVPGEDAVVDVVKGGRRAEGRLVALLRKSPDVIGARCRHFGRCGGCQWQHLSLEAQRRLKTRLAKDYLKEHAEVRRDLVAEATGDEGWAYRNTIRAVFAERDGVAIAGYHAGGSSRVLDIVECPVQHPTNEAILRAARHAVRTLRLPVYDRSTGTGLVRGVLGLTSFATGQALLTLSSVAPLSDPTALVLALIDQVPGLVGILHTVSPRRAVDLLGPRLRLLWGRDHIEEEIAGFRVRLRPTTELPANPRAIQLLVDAVVRAAALRSDETAADLAAATPVVTFALAQVAASAVGVVPSRRVLTDAWEAAGWNGVGNASFTPRRSPAALLMMVGPRRPDVVVVQAEGPGLDPALIGAVEAAGIPRAVYLARSLPVCARDLALWRGAGYAVASVQPVDLLPQTSHLHLVVALHRRRPSA
ncbi:MAG: 23S rRNA (uracil(1939)-C(5))-methyltransferase RlmD [Armatimonadota bacterium]|nr:23S rRNA (uracil(1939)-C(5))-methyltransferase RlmD [Armatimonadota bacterium]